MAEKEIIVITGSNSGLGFLTSQLLSDKPYHIIITSRTLDKAQEAVEKLQTDATTATYEAYELNVDSADGISSFAEQLRSRYDHIDVLVNNAGIANESQYPKQEDTSAEATAKRFELGQIQYRTNVIGPDALTYALLPLLKKSKSGRLIFTTSGLGSMALNLDPKDDWYGVSDPIYRSTKSAVNMLMTNWHKRLRDQGTGIGVWAVCPGWNATNFGGHDPDMLRKFGAQEPEIGAKVIADVVMGKRKGDEGRVVAGNGKFRPW